MSLIIAGKQLTQCCWPGCTSTTLDSFCVHHFSENPFKKGTALRLADLNTARDAGEGEPE